MMILGVPSAKQAMKKSFFQDMQEKDILKLMQQRNRKIRKLEYKVEKLQKQKEYYLQKNFTVEKQSNKFVIFRDKIAQQIKQNDKAIQLLIQTLQKVTKVIQLLQTPNQLSSSSSEIMKLLQIFQNNQQSYSGSSEIQSSSQSYQKDHENIHAQLIQKLQELEMIASQFRKAFFQMQKQCSQITNKVRVINKQHFEEIDSYLKQIKDQRQKKQHYKICLQNVETQKNELINNIATMTVREANKNLEDMDKNQLKTFIRKLLYRLKDLQNQKLVTIKNYNRNKQKDLQKYKKMLKQVKLVKQKNSLAQSLY